MIAHVLNPNATSAQAILITVHKAQGFYFKERTIYLHNPSSPASTVRYLSD